ncbi:thymidylate synthase (FAD) [Candidatus Pacearchaeota archaeon]|nr:thymidylate synthase (FAD) [Candidatus Pacearchaeota archaeon]|tara:strand:- start:1006 stop:1887 length:882 start_codon:yes stop_codon:yes gene_type:complete
MNNSNIPNQEKSHPAFEVYKVLDKGFIRLVDCMPSPCDPNSISADDAIAQMARVSYGGGTDKKRDNSGLINYLMENRHTSPFEGVVLKFHIKMPIFVERQMSRHRTSSQNQLSARYSVLPNDFYIPNPDRCQGQDVDMKQGSCGHLSNNEKISKSINEESNTSYKKYEELLEMGLSRELARTVLSVNIYTEAYWMMNLHNLLHFINLRVSPHAQYEIREYAEKMRETVKRIAPITLNSWEKHVQKSISFSKEDMSIIKECSNVDIELIKNKTEELGWSKRKTDKILSKLNSLS